jgi:hypothetical protein
MPPVHQTVRKNASRIAQTSYATWLCPPLCPAPCGARNMIKVRAFIRLSLMCCALPALAYPLRCNKAMPVQRTIYAWGKPDPCHLAICRSCRSCRLAMRAELGVGLRHPNAFRSHAPDPLWPAHLSGLLRVLIDRTAQRVEVKPWTGPWILPPEAQVTKHAGGLGSALGLALDRQVRLTAQ